MTASHDDRLSELTRPLLKSIAADPLFTLASHGYAHENMAELGAEEVGDSLDLNADMLATVGEASPYFRFPYRQ